MQVAPWSARRISRISNADLTVDFFFLHFVKPKRYPFAALNLSNNPPVPAGKAPGLVSITHIETLYASEPWKSAFTQIKPVSFRRVRWFDQLATLYQEYEDRSCNTYGRQLMRSLSLASRDLMPLVLPNSASRGNRIDRDLDPGGSRSFGSSAEV